MLGPHGQRSLIFMSLRGEILPSGVHKGITRDRAVCPYGPYVGMWSGVECQNNKLVSSAIVQWQNSEQKNSSMHD